MGKIESLLFLSILFVGSLAYWNRHYTPPLTPPRIVPINPVKPSDEVDVKPVKPEVKPKPKKLAYCNSDKDFAKWDKKNTVLVFSAAWCPPCKTYKPIVAKLSKELTDTQFVIVDVDKCPKSTRKKGVKSLPTTMLNAKTLVGSDTYSNLRRWVLQYKK